MSSASSSAQEKPPAMLGRRKPFFHGWWFMLPALATFFWLATLLSLLLWWTVEDGARKYEVSESTVVFISDAGAAHKWLFITGNALTFAFYSATLVAERWLRHIRRIPGSFKRSQSAIDIFAVIFGIIGGAALLFLAIFDAFNYSTVHWSLTLVFVVGVAVSAILQTWEVMWLERNHVRRNHLRRNAIFKLVIVTLAVASAIVFGVTYAQCSSQPEGQPPSDRCNVIGSVCASFEWFVALLFDIYLFTFVLDLWPAKKTQGHKLSAGLMDADRRAGMVDPSRDETLRSASSSEARPSMGQV